MISELDNFNLNSSVVQKLPSTLFHGHSEIYIKRDDLIHPIVSGNKYRKLKFNIIKAKELGITKLITYGGAFSNHMVATAAAGAAHGFETHCFIRGEELKNNFNHYLKTAALYGMKLIAVERQQYANHKLELFETYFGSDNSCMCIPEGGETEEALLGVAEIVNELPFAPDILLHASATATTGRGLLMGIATRGYATKLLPVSVLKNSEEQALKISTQFSNANFELLSDYDFGGYAKTSPELFEFIKTFVAATGIFIDPVYTGKALFALRSLIENGIISKAKKVVFLHTGGTLGIFSDRFLEKI